MIVSIPYNNVVAIVLLVEYNIISYTQTSRVVFPGHVIRLRCDIAVNRSKILLDNLQSSEQSTDTTAGKLRSARYTKLPLFMINFNSSRLLPMGMVQLNGSDKKCLGIITGEDISDVF